MRLCVCQKLQEHGIATPVASTPRLSILRGGRAAEILAWISESQPNRWVALDDVDISIPAANNARSPFRLPSEHFVHVNTSEGLSESDADRVIQLLQSQQAGEMAIGSI